jgi:peptide/nickel transport system substrate-binding protein
LHPQGKQTSRAMGAFAPSEIGFGLLVCCLGALAALGSACKNNSPARVVDSTLTIGLGYGGTSKAPALQTFLDSLYTEPLISIGWNGRPQPRLADSWKWSDGGRTLLLHLAKGVVFQDGTPLTAPIVAAGLRQRIGQGGFGRVESVAADGEDKVIFRLREPDSFLLAELSTGNIKKGTDQSVGTGPFVLTSRGPEVVLEAFPKYHLGQPSIRKIVVRTYNTPRASWAAMMRGEIEFLHEVNRDAVGFLEAGSQIQIFSFPRPYYIPIVFNITHPILGRREVRRAINEAIDRSEIVAKALHGRGQPADGPIWPYHWAYNSANRTYSYNPEAARIRLDAAGLPLLEARRGEMPRRFRFRCLFWAEDADFERIALVVQKQLSKIGIDVEMIPMTLADIGKRHAAGNFEAIIVQMTSSRSLDWVYWFWRSVPAGLPAYGRSGYTAADSVLDRLRSAQSEEETRLAVADLQRILYEDPPAAFLVRAETARAVDRSFRIPNEEKGRDILGTLWQWTPSPAAELQTRR